LKQLTLLLLFLSQPLLANDVVQQLLSQWQPEAERTFSAAAGELVWMRESRTGGPTDGRNCGSCHSEDLSAQGRHKKTGKIIEPIAPSANPERLTNRKKINKWLLRNCKWTFGRECTAQEKGDVLVWLSKQ